MSQFFSSDARKLFHDVANLPLNGVIFIGLRHTIIEKAKFLPLSPKMFLNNINY